MKLGRRCVEFRVQGRVQGVGFRFSAREEARRLDLAGWVRNEPNGDVRVAAEGDPAAIEEFHGWLRRGPALARVLEVRVEDLRVQAPLPHPFAIER